MEENKDLEEILLKKLADAVNFCVCREWKIERVSRRNRSAVYRCSNSFISEVTPEIPFVVQIAEDKPDAFRLSFPTEKARKDADEYDVREYLKEYMKTVLQ